MDNIRKILDEIMIPEHFIKSMGPISNMLNKQSISIEKIANKEEVLLKNKQIDRWFQIKEYLLSLAESNKERFDFSSLAQYLIKKGYSVDEPNIEYPNDFYLRQVYSDLDCVSSYFLNAYYKDYIDWCNRGDFRIYFIGHMLSEEIFEEDALLAGSLLLYYFNKENYDAVDITKQLLQYDLDIKKMTNSIIALDGVLGR